jgi:hypothetical protein
MSAWLSPKKQNPIVTDMINENKGKRFPSPPSESWLKELKKMDVKRLNSNANWLSPKKSKSKKGGAKNKRSQKTKSRNFRKTRHRSRV